ncbi:MAG: site-specific integrase [Actinomycetota bacterium]|nr:site-specific integrase [Actinomycetota bacterium]
MASRKRGSVRVRGKSISVVLDLGEQPWRKCPTSKCTGSVFTERAGDMVCERCGAPLAPPTLQRRRVWHSGYRNKGEANKALTAMLGTVDEGTFAPATALTVRDFIEKHWRPAIESSELRPTTRDLYLRTTTNYVLPHLGSVKLRDLSPARIVVWLTGLKGSGTGARTVELAGTTLHKILSAALDLELIARNPADNRAVRAARGTAKAPAPVVWTPEQTRAFLDSQRGDRLYPLWRLAACTGLRRGELAGLRWSDIDLDSGALKVSTTRVVVGWEVVESGPKTHAGARVIGLDAGSVATLRQHRKAQLEERLRAGELWQGTTDLVFVDELGRALHPGYLTRTLTARARGAGLPPVRLHALRHGHATHGLESGVPLAVMSKRLGHASIRITADTYSHVTAAVDQAAADQVAALIDSANV